VTKILDHKNILTFLFIFVFPKLKFTNFFMIKLPPVL